MENQNSDIILSPDALSFLEEMVASTLAKEENKADGNKKRLVPVKEWLDSPYYTGELGRSLYPFWRDRLEEIFNGYKLTCDELVVTGGIRTGKTWLCIGVWMRMLYLLSLLEYPQDYLGLARTTEIVFAYLSITIQSAFTMGFGELTRIIDSAPYFNEEFPRNKNKNTILQFPKNIMIICGSDYSKFVSSAMVSLFYDEGNFAKVSGGEMGDLEKAMSVYSNARTRTTSQFTTERNTGFSINMLVSSTTHEGSFTEEIIKSSKTIASTKVIQAQGWISKPKGTYSDKKFLFFTGTKLSDPRVIECKEDLRSLVSQENYDKIVDGDAEKVHASIPIEYTLTFHLVPINFKNDAIRLPKQFVRDVMGISLASTGKFFTNKAAWERAILRAQAIPMIHPFTKEIITLSRLDDIEIRDYLMVDVLRKVVANNPLYAHIDQSESGCNTAITLAFPIRFPGEELARIYVPAMLRIVPPGDGDKISLVKIRTFVEDLRDRFGFNIGQITFDQYQSSQSIEILEGKGFPVGRLSVDISDNCWFEVAETILRDRLTMYDYKPLKEEFFDLVHDVAKRKIEKTRGVLRDCSDSFVGAVVGCLMGTDPKPNVSKQAEIMAKAFKQLSQNEPKDINSMLLGSAIIHESGSNFTDGFNNARTKFGNFK